MPEHIVSGRRLLPEVHIGELEAAKGVMPEWFGDSPDDVRFTLNAFALRDAERTVLIDTGMPLDTQNATLQASLERAGIAPENVDLVVLTHRDIDHVGGTLRAGEPAYPNARYVIGKSEFEGFRSDAPRAEQFERFMAPLVSLGLLDVVADDSELTDGLKLWTTPGHTSGVSSVVVEERAIVLGDIWHTALQVAHPEWASRFDQDRELAESARRRVIADARENDWLIAVPHTPDGGFGRVRERWMPILP